MTKTEFINAVYAHVDKGISKKQTTTILEAAFEEAGKAIKKDGRFSWPDFATFSVKRHGARKGRNPRTGQTIEIAARNTLSIKAAPQLRDQLNPTLATTRQARARSSNGPRSAAAPARSGRR